MDTLHQLQSNIINGTMVPFDFVFLDADKRCYKQYYDYLISNSILKSGGVILADNVLFKGLVINSSVSCTTTTATATATATTTNTTLTNNNDTVETNNMTTTTTTTKKKTPSPSQQKLNYWKRRHQDIANTVHEFNIYVNADSRSSVVLLPLRDGLSIIRKK
jgi:predicted O-methyltransferase YrrM